jgi:hypothetical protein
MSLGKRILISLPWFILAVASMCMFGLRMLVADTGGDSGTPISESSVWQSGDDGYSNDESGGWWDWGSDSGSSDWGSSGDSGWDSWDSGSSDSGGWDSWDSGSDSGGWDSWDSGSDSGSW